MTDRKTGVCTGWAEKGFGYIKDQNSEEIFFCHRTALIEWGNLIVNDRVEFTPAPPHKGELRRAVDVIALG